MHHARARRVHSLARLAPGPRGEVRGYGKADIMDGIGCDPANEIIHVGIDDGVVLAEDVVFVDAWLPQKT